MVYALIKAYSRIAHRILFRGIRVNGGEAMKRPGPILFAANHPNSFLDGIILTTLFDGSLHSLARGDAFRNPKAGRWLRRLRLLPVYRQSEGVENLAHNYATFDECLQAFSRGESVLIFSEGRCENEWHLRPLKKGTARLAFAAWQKGIPLTVIPTGFNYSSFHHLGKEVHLGFGLPIAAASFDPAAGEGRQHLLFNQQLEAALHELVYEIPAGDADALRRHFPSHPNLLLLLPGAAGWILHLPLLLITRLLAERFRHSGHYDSVVAAILLLAYPLYLLLVCLIASFRIGAWSFGLFFLLPLSAWCATRAFGR